MNSVLQMLCCATELAEKYHMFSHAIFEQHCNPPEEDLILQFCKFVLAVWTDRYAVPGHSRTLETHNPETTDGAEDTDNRTKQLNTDQVRPRSLKKLLGLKNHFGTGEQQDAL